MCICNIETKNLTELFSKNCYQLNLFQRVSLSMSILFKGMLTLYFKAFSWPNTHKIPVKVFADLNMVQRYPVFVLAYKITE